MSRSCRRACFNFTAARMTAFLFAGMMAASALWPAAVWAQAGAAESAVVLVYQRFGENDKAANSVKLAELDAHIARLTDGRFNVMPLPDILAAIGKGEKLSNRTIAITIDDSFRSVYEKVSGRYMIGHGRG
jgi:hypothetical protein